jgi:hypothetical protein
VDGVGIGFVGAEVIEVGIISLFLGRVAAEGDLS